MVTLLTRFDTKNRASADDIKTVLLDLSDKVRSEPGYVSYQAFSTEDEPPVFWVLESWDKQEDADRHGQLVVANGTIERATPALSGPIATSSLSPL